jgi:cyclic beta-1,2-glucan synthetase
MTTSSAELTAPVGTRAGSTSRFFIDLGSSEPIRAEQYGLENLEACARDLAKASSVTPGPAVGHPLLRRFVESGRRLAEAHRRIVAASQKQEALTPDAEWLLDNFHIVEETLREVETDLPRGYYKKLSKLAAGPLKGQPRVYALALELIAHTDSCLDEANISHFVQAYQTVSPLSIGELWAVPIMLRLGLLENLRRLADQMDEAWDHRQRAEAAAARLVALQDEGSRPATHPQLPTILPPHLKASGAFVVRLLQVLRDHGPRASELIEWLESHFTACAAPPAEVLHREHQRQAANQVSVGNSVTSLRLLSALDWSTLFERMSLLEIVLGRDPAGVYAQQDFATRDHYRREVEQLARRSPTHDELAIARHIVLECAAARQRRTGESATANGARPRVSAESHVGYYLVGEGRPQLEVAIQYRPTLADRLYRAILDHARLLYFGSLVAVFALILAGLAAYAGRSSWGVTPILLLLAALVPASELAVGVVHYVVTLVLRPRVLPKLDLRKGIPNDCATFVVMPTMLLRPESAAALTEKLEVHHLSNPDPQLRFALLTDFADAPTQRMPEDESYLTAALERVKALNERYSPDGPPRFFLFHRKRQWNPVQGCWMGWERKRGKLVEFNRLLRGARETSYTDCSVPLEQVPHVRYVITLDADTQLPREAAPRLIGALAHPLNQPRFDAAQGRVVHGYGLLQPRVSLSMVAATRSLFARILASSAGIDPYTTAVSDVYQDLFGLGSFTGKGVYDVDAFEAATGHTFPDNHILSHDLIEGNYARCGLVTDIELLDDFPARYHAYARREHRWIRGDWQLLPWLLPTVPIPAPGKDRPARRRNSLPAVERWKILDNLRRSLVPPCLVLLLALAWLLPDSSAGLWTIFALIVPGFPLLQYLLSLGVDLLRGGSWLLKLRDAGGGLIATGGQFLLAVVFLAEQARLAVDAIVRTLVRMAVTHRKLLEWETAASTERRLGIDFAHFSLTMWPAPVLAIALGLAVGLLQPLPLVVALPILLAWFFSPAIAFAVSQPRRMAEPPLSAEERRELRRVARKTWGFFETFVTATDHWLPPDNYQEDPKGVIAPRTSPTNMGLYLLSCLAAHDFGYLSMSALLGRLENTLDTLEQLERYQGHFYNWYDTRMLHALPPRYVSTVDSGNLLGCLLTLKQGLRQKIEEPLPSAALPAALADTLALAAEELQGIEPPTEPEQLKVFQALDASFAKSALVLERTPADLLEWDTWLGQLDGLAANLSDHVQELSSALQEVPENLQRWVWRFANQVREQRQELAHLLPWVEVLRPHAGAATYRTLLVSTSLADWQEELESVPPEAEAITDLKAALQKSGVPEFVARCHKLADRAGALAQEMDFKILYNEQRHLFSIGLNLAHNRLDSAHYDLLASEACLTSFLAIARGDAPKRHWFQLGRLLTRAGDGIALISWGGTMFEYLMPRLLLKGYAGTLLEESCRAVVDRQIEYCRQRHVPWGISESAFNAFDAALNYQYQSFGVPGLGLKRALSQDLVIAPYATALALTVRPHLALANLRRLQSEGLEGAYGFYEAIDYTRDRLVEKRRPAIVRCFMAHHQGMSLLALNNCLSGDPMVRRFHAEPMVQATELLLQERVPRVAPLIEPHSDESAPRPVVREKLHPMSRRVTTPHTPHPRTHLLSNGGYCVMVTNAGGGFSTWHDIEVTRWREDRTRDCWGQFLYLRDLRSGLVWSAGYQPVGRAADDYEVIYSTDKAEFRRIDGGIETHLEITVSPENAAEVRRVMLTNHNARAHDLELTSYMEVVLGPRGADLAHPAFGKLFLETEFLPNEEALLCRRRPRAADQKPIWAIHVLAVEGAVSGAPQFETDRARFLGRGRTPANPAALERGAILSGSTGPVLDPILSLRRRLRVPPGSSVSLAFTTAVAESREQALVLADQYHDFHGVTRAFELAWAHSQVQLRHLRLSGEEAHLFQRLASQVLYAGPTLRSASAVAANQQGQPALWRYGISGDRPIVLLSIAEATELPLADHMLAAHGYWHLKGLAVDLVLLNEHPTSYYEELQEQLQAMVRSSDSHALADKPGGVFVRKVAQMSAEDRILLQAAARVVLAGDRGSLAAQVDRSERPVQLPARLTTSGRKREAEHSGQRLEAAQPPTGLLFANRYGGFAPDGGGYCITVAPQLAESRAKPSLEASGELALPPAPWINVVANPRFGFLVSESGGGYTWAANSQQNRLTPWNNDPVSDPPGEVVYLRDESTGEFWTPTPLPVPATTPTIVHHGQGYTLFEQVSHGLAQELLLFVPLEDPVKVIRLRVRNGGSRPRRLSAAFYAEWVLGTLRGQAPMNVVPWLDPATGALLARNAYNPDFATRLAFADVSLRPRTLTADRTEFLGRNGSPAAPAALSRVELSGRVEPTFDPCAAFLAPFDLEPGEEKDVIFLLGEAANPAELEALLRRYRQPGHVQNAFTRVCERWERILTAVQVRTPDPAVDLLLNRWLLYQVLSCRVWARSALYQSGGAYGFRDQLQDVMALAHGAPSEERAQLLRAAARQFVEGDVQHWWHPPAGRGVRTRISDDFLWLPLVAHHYVTTTGDYAILDEPVPFLKAPLLRPDQEEEYGAPDVAPEPGSLYDHCVRAIEHGLRFGAHGLPLMGTGDWNDGMNRVGVEGKGESVWNGWFLLTILRHFACVAERRGDGERATRYCAESERLRGALEEQGWDGRWYRRAYFDDGTPLGSAQNDECRIDSIAQSWAVLSSGADPARARRAMDAVDELLVREADKLILLFTPPFDHGKLQPGYIKGYVPGIRENGGQYTHAATWVVQAAAVLGRGDRALQLFNLLNPIYHATTPQDLDRYKVEPYVIAADVYSMSPHIGRGGWTWYTGSAGWLYRVGLEAILGFHREGKQLRIKPCIPAHWPQYELTYRYGSAVYHIIVENPHGARQGFQCITLDGQPVSGDGIELTDDSRTHEVHIEWV